MVVCHSMVCANDQRLAMQQWSFGCCRTPAEPAAEQGKLLAYGTGHQMFGLYLGCKFISSCSYWFKYCILQSCSHILSWVFFFSPEIKWPAATYHWQWSTFFPFTSFFASSIHTRREGCCYNKTLYWIQITSFILLSNSRYGCFF